MIVLDPFSQIHRQQHWRVPVNWHKFHAFPFITYVKPDRLLAVVISALPTYAQDLYWDINGGANWSTTDLSWSPNSTGGSTQAWVDGSNAIFSSSNGPTGTIAFSASVVGAITVDDITQNAGRIRLTTGAGGAIALAGTSTITTNLCTTGDYDLRVDPAISGSGGIVKSGTGILLFTNSGNSFTGGVTLNQGTLAIEGAATNTLLGTGTVTLNGGTFVRSFANAGVSINTQNTLNITGNTKIGAIQQNNGNWILSGAWSAGSTSGRFDVSNLAADYNGFAPSSTTVQVTGNISAFTGTIAHNNLASGGNRLRFGAANAGSITYDAANAKFLTSGSTTGGNCLDLADGTYGTFRMGELAGTGGRVRAGWAAGGNTTFEVGALNTASKFGGVLENNPNGSNGLAALSKVGTGTLEFSVASGNLYSAGTTVTAGRLLVSNTSGSGTGTGAVTVASGAILGGSGIITPTGANGFSVSGIMAPGGSVSAATGGSFSSSVGSLTINLGSTTGNIQMLSGSSFNFELGTAGASLASVGTSDRLNLAGTAAAGDLAFNLNSVDFLGTGEAGYYLLIDTTAADNTVFSGLTFDSVTGVLSSGLTGTNLAGGLAASFIVGTASNGGNLGDLYLSVQPVPEPSAAVLIGAAATGLLTFRRRRGFAGM